MVCWPSHFRCAVNASKNNISAYIAVYCNINFGNKGINVTYHFNYIFLVPFTFSRSVYSSFHERCVFRRSEERKGGMEEENVTVLIANGVCVCAYV